MRIKMHNLKARLQLLTDELDIASTTVTQRLVSGKSRPVIAKAHSLLAVDHHTLNSSTRPCHPTYMIATEKAPCSPTRTNVNVLAIAGPCPHLKLYTAMTLDAGTFHGCSDGTIHLKFSPRDSTARVNQSPTVPGWSTFLPRTWRLTVWPVLAGSAGHRQTNAISQSSQIPIAQRQHVPPPPRGHQSSRPHEP